MNFIMEGGPIFMVPLLLLLIAIVVLFIKALKNNSDKTISLLNSLALFAFVFGVLGFVVGLLGALDAISSSTVKVSSQILAGGLKVALLSPAFGMVIFLVGKLFTIIITSQRK